MLKCLLQRVGGITVRRRQVAVHISMHDGYAIVTTVGKQPVTLTAGSTMDVYTDLVFGLAECEND